MIDAQDRARRARRRRGPGKWYYLFVAVVTLGALCASTAVGLLTGFINSLPPIEQLENYDPPQATVVTDRRDAEIGRFSSERRQVVEIEEIPVNLRNAVLAIEDARFHEHFGVDPKAALGSLRDNLRAGGKVRGGSTITMQLPRNILPEEVSRSKTWQRKLKEIILALQIERRYSKDQILEFYLNQISMGYNAFGVHEAAFTYFSKTPRELTLAECATLAGIPKGPSIYNPIDRPDRARQRRNTVLLQMLNLGWIGRNDYDNARAEPVAVARGRRSTNVHSSEHPYFVDALWRDLTDYQKIEAIDLRERGWTVRSTIEPRYQRIAEEGLRRGLVQVEADWNAKKRERFWKEAEDFPGSPRAGQTRLMRIAEIGPDSVSLELDGYRSTVPLPVDPPYYNPADVLKVGGYLDVRISSVDRNRTRMVVDPADRARIQGSVVILDARRAEVLALVGGESFHDARNDGQYNRAVQGGRPAGSTVKPFFYAAALQSGFAPHDMIFDEPVHYPDGAGGAYRPRNYENAFFGATTLIEGVEHSRNVVTIRLFETVGIAPSVRMVALFDPARGNAAWRRKLAGGGLPTCLGTTDLSPFEIAAAYLPFLGHGVERRPRYFSRIADRDERTVYEPPAEESIVLDPIVAHQLLYMLRQVVIGGSGERNVGSRFKPPDYPPIAGKTGTTNDSTDAWFVGLTPDLIMVVHVGFDTPRTLGPEMTGGRTAAPIWADIFEKVYATRDDWRMEFEAPTGIETVDICGHTGKLTSTICAQYHPAEVYKAVPYRLGAAPTEKCNDVPRKPIVERFAPPRVRLPGTPPPPGGVMKPFGGSLKGRSP